MGKKRSLGSDFVLTTSPERPMVVVRLDPFPNRPTLKKALPMKNVNSSELAASILRTLAAKVAADPFGAQRGNERFLRAGRALTKAVAERDAVARALVEADKRLMSDVASACSDLGVSMASLAESLANTGIENAPKSDPAPTAPTMTDAEMEAATAPTAPTV